MTRRAARGRRADFARKIGADYSRRWPNCNVAGSPLFTWQVLAVWLAGACPPR